MTWQTAQGAFNETGLPQGWWSSSQVGWFCYDFSKNWSIDGESYIQVAATSSVAANRNLARQGSMSVTPGNRLYWFHDMRNSGPDAMDKTVTYQVNKTGFTNGWNNITAPAGAASGGGGALFVKQYAPSAAYATYDVTQSDVGNTLCERISWVPGSSGSSARAASGYACANVPYNYGLTPSIANITDGAPIETSHGSISIQGNVSNNTGTTKSQTNIQWQITQAVYKPSVNPIPHSGGGVSSSNPCAFFSGSASCGAISGGAGTEAAGYGKGASKTYSGTGSIGDLPVGTHVCYAMSIKRNSSSSADWRHSKLYCLVVGKQPKVQVQGGDLIVGRGSVSNPGRVAGVVTSITHPGSGPYYGSWAEYGILPSGIVSGMASGAGFSGGSTVGSSSNLCAVSLLTFANAGSTSCGAGSTLGGYKNTSIAPNIAGRFPLSSKTPQLPSNAIDITGNDLSGLYTSSSATLAVVSSSEIAAGQWVVVNAPNSTVTIGGDIHYTAGQLHSVRDIPQVVIIAKNIIIADNVSNIDAWLVATGSGTEGRINTCGAGGVNESTVLNANICNSKLTVNGPVLANHLIMRRTGGAGVGTAAGDPAEVFNLRADAYVWASNYSPSTGRIPTVETKELPPRF